MPAQTETHPAPAEPHAGSAAAAAVKVERLSKTYPVQLAGLRRLFRRKTPAPAAALTDVSLEIREGEIFGLIGRNGAGKTTLAKIVGTLVQPTSGTVTVRGFDSVRDETRVRAQVGLASAEERSFYWRLTVEQNLLFFARLYGLDDRAGRRRVAELVALFGLGDDARRRFGQLSTGNKQRVSVARAMIADPPVLLLDEPTRSLDPLAAAGVRRTVRALADRRPAKTVLLTSHNLAEIEELCARVAVISRGRIRALGTPAELRALHRPNERVRLTVRGVAPARLRRDLDGLGLRELEIRALEESGAGFVAADLDADSLEPVGGCQLRVKFTRAVEDDQLDRALASVAACGGHVVSCEAERSTLLDVLEQYESEGSAGDHDATGGARA